MIERAGSFDSATSRQGSISEEAQNAFTASNNNTLVGSRFKVSPQTAQRYVDLRVQLTSLLPPDAPPTHEINRHLESGKRWQENKHTVNVNVTLWNQTAAGLVSRYTPPSGTSSPNASFVREPSYQGYNADDFNAAGQRITTKEVQPYLTAKRVATHVVGAGMGGGAAAGAVALSHLVFGLGAQPLLYALAAVVGVGFGTGVGNRIATRFFPNPQEHMEPHRQS